MIDSKLRKIVSINNLKLDNGKNIEFVTLSFEHTDKIAKG